MDTYFDYNFRDYHSNMACGKDDGIGLTESYTNRFYCDTKDPYDVKVDKYKKAKACFTGRVNVKRGKTLRVASASDSNHVNKNNRHDRPLKLAYVFAKDCAPKIGINATQFEKRAETFVKANDVSDVQGLSYLIPEIKMEPMPYITPKPDPVGFISHVPETCGIKPRAEREFITHLANLPLLNHKDRQYYFSRLIQQRNCLLAKQAEPGQQQNKKLQNALEQINMEFLFLTKIATDIRNTAHESNKIRILENYGKKEFGNSTRSATNYYKSMRNTFKKTRKLRYSKF
jgi:hypothetical protein